jgi:hypothetical protein
MLPAENGKKHGNDTGSCEEGGASRYGSPDTVSIEICFHSDMARSTLGDKTYVGEELHRDILTYLDGGGIAVVGFAPAEFGDSTSDLQNEQAHRVEFKTTYRGHKASMHWEMDWRSAMFTCT